MSGDQRGDNLEVEVKFLVDLDDFRPRLAQAGARQIHPRTYEHNIRFDNAWDGLSRKGQLLRLRQDTAVRITFKALPEDDGGSEAKVRQELEIEVSDFETTAVILNRIGFEAKQIYEKYRETFELDGVEVVLDEMPFGEFVELEGEEAAIRRAAGALGLDWETRLLDNYLSLMARLKAHHDLPFDDLTFDNFDGRDIHIADILESADVADLGR